MQTPVGQTVIEERCFNRSSSHCLHLLYSAQSAIQNRVIHIYKRFSNIIPYYYKKIFLVFKFLSFYFTLMNSEICNQTKLRSLTKKELDHRQKSKLHLFFPSLKPILLNRFINQYIQGNQPDRARPELPIKEREKKIIVVYFCSRKLNLADRDSQNTQRKIRVSLYSPHNGNFRAVTSRLTQLTETKQNKTQGKSK